MRPRWILAVLSGFVAGALAALVLAAGGCGARSELDLPPALRSDGGASNDAGAPDADADAPTDAGPDAPPVDCTEQGITYVYVITVQRELYAFYPPNLSFSYRGTINCPGNGTPFSMGVDRQGTAYVIYSEGELFRVSTKDASCEPTSYVPPAIGFTNFGSAFVAEDDNVQENLYVADINYETSSSAGLGRIDVVAEHLEYIGPWIDAPGFRIELTGAGNQLHGFAIGPNDNDGFLLDIDKQTAVVSNPTPLALGNDIGSWAFAFWGGDFWFFTELANAGSSTVTRYHPDDGSLTPVATFQGEIVGAGVSTCAPL